MNYNFFNILNAHHNVSRETFEKLLIYKNLLFKWQKAINLVSRETLDDFWNRHILDSLQLLKYIDGKRILDIGSGAGFPGMVIAICGNFDVTCIDSNGKKIIFLEEVKRLTSANVDLKSIRIEDFCDCSYDVVCARGFSSLCNLLFLTHRYSSSKRGIFLKGARINKEIMEAKRLYRFEYEIFQSKTDEFGKIIAVNNVEIISGQNLMKSKNRNMECDDMSEESENLFCMSDV
jgi:16S rRNA (guanine527-N7)-methyltransferase